MSAKNFKVGQIWETRDGARREIASITQKGSYPIETVSGTTYTIEGYYNVDRPNADSRDLTRLVKDAKTDASKDAEAFLAAVARVQALKAELTEAEEVVNTLRVHAAENSVLRALSAEIALAVK